MKQKHIVKYFLHLYDNDSIAVRLKFVEREDVVDGVGGGGGVTVKEAQSGVVWSLRNLSKNILK